MSVPPLARAVYESPLGPLTLVGGPGGLRALRFAGDVADLPAGGGPPDALEAALSQLAQYFAGRRRSFDLPLDLRGAPLPLRVWHALARIPFGHTISYGRLAAAVGRADDVRRVAACVARTPVPVVLPCHRVVGADGALTGYGGGLERKAALLRHEGAPFGRGAATRGQLTML